MMILYRHWWLWQGGLDPFGIFIWPHPLTYISSKIVRAAWLQAALLLPAPSAPQNLTGCRLQIERPDGSSLTLMLLATPCAFLRDVSLKSTESLLP
jgi:hypothetical protein